MEHNQYLTLVQTINEHNYRYHALNAPTISDPEFDDLFRQLSDYEQANPTLIAKDTPTTTVGSSELIAAFEPHDHEIPMLSLDNAFNNQEIEKHFKSLSNDTLFTAEPKMDGLAMSLIFENNTLSVASTRGDKRVGENVTANVMQISRLPKQLNGDLPERFEVRGEVYLDFETLNRINEQRTLNDLPLYKNTRNAAAGAIRSLKSNPELKRHLRFMAYTCHSLSSEDEMLPISHFERLTLLKQLGFDTNNLTSRFSLSETQSYIDSISEQRAELPFAIDGIVFKVDNISKQNSLGTTSRAPKWAIAFKFPAEVKTTTLNSVTWQVGHSGILTPVAELTPVLVDGSVISRATLHNMDIIKQKDLHLGDIVEVRKAGDVVPEVIRPVLSQRTTNSAITLPTQCPSCQHPISPRPEGMVGHQCINQAGCPAQLAGYIKHITSKKGLNVDGLGDATIVELVDKGIVTKASDLFRLDTYTLISQLTGFAAKKANKLINAIHASLHTELRRFIYALAIEEVGESLSTQLAHTYITLDALRAASYNNLLSQPNIGDKTARNIATFFIEQGEKVDELLSMGFVITSPEQKKESHITGKSVVVTGTFKEKYARKDIEKILKQHGAKIIGKVSSNTDYVLFGDKAGSKLSQANDLITQGTTISLFNESETISLVDSL